jgi:methionine synthase II (cobalamin-independent)
VAKPETQVVTHLCYSDFEDILPAIDGLKGALQQTMKSTAQLPCAVSQCGTQYA